MKFTLEDSAGAPMVNAWEPGAITVDGQRFERAVAVSTEAVSALEVDSYRDLDASTLLGAFTDAPEILIVGTGTRQHFLPGAVVKELAARGVGVEVMDSIAAARTYNVLVGEGRRVAAVLLAP